MLTKTKTASIILQKQLQRQKSQVHSQENHSTQIQIQIQTQKTINRQQQKNKNKNRLALRHLGHYNVYSETFRGEKQRQTQDQENAEKTLANLQNLPQEYCQLEKQNYRLIQANFNLLNKFAGILGAIRKELISVVQYIQQYHYVVAVQTVYGLLDMIRNIADGSQKMVYESSKFNRIQPVKRNISINFNHIQIKQPKDKQNSVVQEYDIKQQSDKATKRIKRPLKINKNVSQAEYFPEKQKLSIDYIVESGQVPHFAQMPRRMEMSGVIPTHQKLLSSMEQLGLYSRVQSAQDNNQKFINESFYAPHLEENEISNQRIYRGGPSSEKCIKVFKNNGKKREFDDKIDEFHRLLFLQATSIEYLLK